eukprot:PITA_33719
MKKEGKSSALLRFKIGEGVEVSSDDDGYKGAWFPATFVKKAGSRNRFVIQYREFTEEGRPNTKLREIVEVPHIRPQPPDLNGQSFCINEVVDAYDRDGWWKGVVKAIRPRSKKYVVYFENTNEQREYYLKHLRVHQVWTDGNWVKASDTEDVGLNELNPSSPQLSSKNPVSIGLESARRSTRANKNRSKARVSKHSGECKVDEQCGNLQSAGSLSAKTVVNISSESARRSTRANKNRTETRNSKLSGERKADEQGGNLQAVGSLSTKNPVNTSLESARRFTRASKNQSETRVSQHSGECKVEEQCGNLKAAGSKSSKRKREGKQQSNYDTTLRKKCPNEKGLEVTGAENEEKIRESVAVDNLQAVGSQLTSKSSKRKRESKDQSNYDNSCKKKCPNEKGLEVTGAEDEDKGLEVNEVEDEEKQRESVAVGPIGDLHENPGSPAEVETMTVSMPYIEYVDQNLCSRYDTPVIRGKGTLKQIQLLAYHTVLEAMYLQNNLDWNGEMLLTNLRDVFQISNEEHAKELKCVTSIQ